MRSDTSTVFRSEWIWTQRLDHGPPLSAGRRHLHQLLASLKNLKGLKSKVWKHISTQSTMKLIQFLLTFTIMTTRWSWCTFSNINPVKPDIWNNVFLCGSVVEHCVSSAKGCGFDSQGTHILTKTCIVWMHCKSLWIKASDKCKCNSQIRFSFLQIIFLNIKIK